MNLAVSVDSHDRIVMSTRSCQVRLRYSFANTCSRTNRSVRAVTIREQTVGLSLIHQSLSPDIRKLA